MNFLERAFDRYSIPRHSGTGYAVAFALAAIGLGLRLMLPIDGVVYASFFITAVISAFLGGMGPGITGVVLGALAGWFFVLPPAGTFLGKNAGSLTSLVSYLVVASICTAIVAGMRSYAHRLREEKHKNQVLLQEVNHRVKNSLQLISSLLTLQGARITDQEQRRQLQEASARVATVGRLHQLLYRGDSTGEVEFCEYLAMLCSELAQAHGFADQSRTCHVKCRELTVTTERAIPLALIVNELLTNAFKYAYEPSQPGAITVSCESPAPGGIRLRVADEGRGLPPGFEPATSSGLGMRIVTALVGQLHGSLQARNTGHGAEFTVEVPA